MYGKLTNAILSVVFILILIFYIIFIIICTYLYNVFLITYTCSSSICCSIGSFIYFREFLLVYVKQA